MALIMLIAAGDTKAAAVTDSTTAVVSGDCTYAGYTGGWINIDGMSFAVSRTTWDKEGSSERSGGKPEFGDVSISKTIDRASPGLFQLTTKGTMVCVIIKQIRTESGVDAGQSSYKPAMQLVLGEALVSSMSNGLGQETTSNSESVTFNFGNIDWKFYAQKEDGSLEGTVAASYDIKQGVDGGAVSLST